MDIAYTFDCYFYKLRFFAFYTAYFSWRLPEIWVQQVPDVGKRGVFLRQERLGIAIVPNGFWRATGCLASTLQKADLDYQPVAELDLTWVNIVQQRWFCC